MGYGYSCWSKGQTRSERSIVSTSFLSTGECTAPSQPAWYSTVPRSGKSSWPYPPASRRSPTMPPGSRSAAFALIRAWEGFTHSGSGIERSSRSTIYCSNLGRKCNRRDPVSPMLQRRQIVPCVVRVSSLPLHTSTEGLMAVHETAANRTAIDPVSAVPEEGLHFFPRSMHTECHSHHPEARRSENCAKTVSSDSHSSSPNPGQWVYTVHSVPPRGPH